jgi:hypothetical protein
MLRLVASIGARAGHATCRQYRIHIRQQALGIFQMPSLVTRALGQVQRPWKTGVMPGVFAYHTSSMERTYEVWHCIPRRTCNAY